MVVTWPDVIKPRDVLFHPQNSSRSGGESTVGTEQIVQAPTGRWRASMAINLRNDEQILAWRSVLAQMRGRSVTILVPAFDARRASWPVNSYGQTLHPGFTRNKRLDGTAYEDLAIPSASAINATVYADAALRDMAATIAISQGSPLIAGQYFGIGFSLYSIATITSTTVVGTGYRQAITFWPELRAAAVAGTTVLLTRPVCEMRFSSDDTGELMLERLRFGQLGLEFVEAF